MASGDQRFLCACELLLYHRWQVVEVYGAIGKMLKTYTAGKLPKAFKIIPSLTNWEQVRGNHGICSNLGYACLWASHGGRYTPVSLCLVPECCRVGLRLSCLVLNNFRPAVIMWPMYCCRCFCDFRNVSTGFADRSVAHRLVRARRKAALPNTTKRMRM